MKVKIERILVPMDFSSFSLAALEYATALAESFGAELHLIHVMEDPVPYARKSESLAIVAKLREELQGEAEAEIKAAAAAHVGSDLTLRHSITWGEPFVDIVRYARDNEIDLIVMGTHGRGAVQHMLLGSVAEKVLRKAPCPVLTVRDPEQEFVLP